MNAEALGGKVWDALEAAGIAPYHETGDGFDVVKHPTDEGHVAVVARRQGALYGVGGRGVTRQMLARWLPTLHRAGFAVELVELDGRPLGLIVAADEAAMRRGVALGLAAVRAARGGAR